MTIKIKKEHPTVTLPVKGTPEAACYDLYADSIETLEDGKVVVHLGFSTEIPKGFKAVIVPRSNLVKHYWIINNQPCQIDSDYRGQWKIFFSPLVFHKAEEKSVREGMFFKFVTVKEHYMGVPEFPYKTGERIAQMYLEKVNDFAFEEATILEGSERGTGGFGSTGK